MGTTSNISTISYNSEGYLRLKLNELVRNHVISFWAAIRHDPEEDEKKSHFHVLCIPNRRVDPMDISDLLKEPQPGNKLPLGCINWRKTKDIDEWLLYVEHDKSYLESKLQERKYHYGREDFISSDEETMEHMYRHAHYASNFSIRQRMLKEIAEGELKPDELINRGVVPFQQANALNAYKHLQRIYGRTNRAGRKTHTPKDEYMDQVSKLIDIVDFPLYDDTGAQLIKCTVCGQVKRFDEMYSTNQDKSSFGICLDCHQAP